MIRVLKVRKQDVVPTEQSNMMSRSVSCAVRRVPHGMSQEGRRPKRLLTLALYWSTKIYSIQNASTQVHTIFGEILPAADLWISQLYFTQEA